MSRDIRKLVSFQRKLMLGLLQPSTEKPGPVLVGHTLTRGIKLNTFNQALFSAA